MAIKGYAYDPNAARNSTAKSLGNLALIGLSMDEDTVRKYLTEAKRASSAGRNRTEMLNRIRMAETELGHASPSLLNRPRSSTERGRNHYGHRTTFKHSCAFRRSLRRSRPIPVSKSTWWARIKSGRYPKPVKLSTRITAWRVEDIRSFIDHGAK